MDKICREVNREEEKKYLTILGDFLVDYGILDRVLVEKVGEIFAKKEIQKALIELLQLKLTRVQVKSNDIFVE